MAPILVGWVSAALAFLALDALWLSQMVPRLYQPLLGDIMRPQLNIAAAAAFYAIYTFGVAYLAVLPALEKDSLTRALLYGAALGLVAYATYNLTNLATLRAWDIRLTLTDMTWGVVATAIAACAGYAAASRIG